MAKHATIRKPSTADAFVGGSAAKPQLTRTTIDVDPDQHRALKIRALQDGYGIADLFRGWVALYLAGELAPPVKEGQLPLGAPPPKVAGRKRKTE